MKLSLSQKIYSISSLTLLPYPVIAAVGPPNTIKDLINRIIDLIGTAIPLLMGVAIVVFLWGIAQSILYASNQEERKKGKQLMVYGVITIFVMVSVWGIVEVLQETFF